MSWVNVLKIEFFINFFLLHLKKITKTEYYWSEIKYILFQYLRACCSVISINLRPNPCPLFDLLITTEINKKWVFEINEEHIFVAKSFYFNTDQQY